MNKDIIYREDAIKAVEDVSENYTKEGDREWHPHIDFITQALVQVPSVPPKQGKWIVNIPNYESICSVCGAKETDFIYGTEMWYGLGESKFCPNCGADMREREDK